MWVRIDEIGFPVARVDEVVARVRNTAVSRHGGEGFRGFRLLVDEPAGRALDVSYWDSQAAAIAGEADHALDPAIADFEAGVRSTVYEMSIDAV